MSLQDETCTGEGCPHNYGERITWKREKIPDELKELLIKLRKICVEDKLRYELSKWIDL